MPEQVQELQQRIEYLEGIVNILIRKDRYYFRRNLDIDNVNLVLKPTIGTKIGTDTKQKLGFWGATPVVQDSFGFNGTMSGTWTAVEQATLQNIQRVLISYGFIHS